MACVTGIGSVFFKSTADHARLAAWYRDSLGLPLEECGGAILKWPDDKAEDLGLTVWHAVQSGRHPRSGRHARVATEQDASARVSQARWIRSAG
jgi:hypothetical protein